MNANHTAKSGAKVQQLKDCLAADLHSAAVPMKVLAAEAGVPVGRAYVYADAHNPELPSLSRLSRLLPAFRTTHLVEYLASLQGHTVVALPSTQAGDLDGLTAMLRTYAALVTHHAEAIADGRLCETDAALYRAHGMRLVQAVLTQMAYVDAQAQARVLRKVTA